MLHSVVADHQLHFYLLISQLDGHDLCNVKQHTYLGVTLTSSMSFTVHINNISSKASKVLNFIKRNLNECSQNVKSIAYCSLVRPILEYSSPVWDPYLIKDIQNSLELASELAWRYACNIMIKLCSRVSCRFVKVNKH